MFVSEDAYECVERGVRYAIRVTEAFRFVPPHMIDGFLLRPILVYLPRKKLVEGMPRQAGARQQVAPPGPRFGKHLRLVRRRHRGGRFIAPVESPILNRVALNVRVELLI